MVAISEEDFEKRDKEKAGVYLDFSLHFDGLFGKAMRNFFDKDVFDGLIQIDRGQKRGVSVMYENK